MARVNEGSIGTFMSITGVTKEVATEILEEHGGDLNAAVNAHFSGDGSTVRRAPVAAPQDDAMDVDDPIEVTDRRDPFSLLSESPMINPFSVLDPQFNRNPLGSDSHVTGRAPFASQPREVREVPVEVKDSSGAPSRSGHGPIVEDATGTEYAHGPAVHSNVIVDVDDDGISNPANSTSHAAPQSDHRNDEYSWPSDPVYDDTLDYGNDIEEQMIRAAIEASRREAQMAEQERALHEQRRNEASEASEPANAELGDVVSSNGRLEEGSTSIKDLDEQPLLRQRSICAMADSMEPAKEMRAIDDRPPSSPGRNDEINGPNVNGDSFYSEEWGGISSLEHDEAVMLEAAMFGGVPEGTGYHSASGPHQFMQNEMAYPRSVPRPPSPSLQAQRLIREQQDDEYNAALAADREKEMKALEETEARRLQEEEARKAALEEERRKEEESKRKLEEEQELERQLAAKEASLPQEPAADDENAITLLVRMPDGSRRGRRFLKSNPLQFLFDYIDIGRAIKPGTYRFVRPYPRRAFSNGESALTLNELGLTSKQEALFLESI